MELKSVYIDRTGDWVRSGNDTGKFYLKSEADKVIAEKDKEIAELKKERDWLAKSGRTPSGTSPRWSICSGVTNKEAK